MLRPGALGDTLLAVPALRALRRLGWSPLTLAAQAGAARLLAAMGEVDRWLAFDHPSLGWLFSDTHASSAAIVAWMNADGVQALGTALVAAPSRPAGAELHCARYLVQTLAALGADGELDERPLRVQPVASGDILVHPGSGSAAKNWPGRLFAETIGGLHSPVRLIVGEADEEPARAVEAYLGRALPRLERAPLEYLAARLAGCRAYLGNDSGVSHLAGLSGANSVVMFGPTPAAVWRPLGPRVRVAPFGTPPEAIAAFLQQ